MLKKIVLFFILVINYCFAEGYGNPTLKNVMMYYFDELVPQYHLGKEDFSEEMNTMHRKYNAGMQGNGFSKIKDTNDIIFDFYYLIDHDKQSVQVIRTFKENVANTIYEYWIAKISDNGIPYNYAYFYLTKAESEKGKRTILDVSKKYMESYELENGVKLDLSIKNLITLYQVAPELKLESFKNTKYENVIVKWKNEKPYLKKMNILEKLYFKSLRKSKRVFTQL